MFVTFVAALVVLALGMWQGTFSAGDGDAYGYVSQSALLATGRRTCVAKCGIPSMETRSIGHQTILT